MENKSKYSEIHKTDSFFIGKKSEKKVFIENQKDKEFKKITHKNISNMHKKFIIDTRRILKISNVEYIALGKNSDNY